MLLPIIRSFGERNLILWAERELKGYEDEEQLPSYRKCIGRIVNHDGVITADPASICVSLAVVEEAVLTFYQHAIISEGRLFPELLSSSQVEKLGQDLWLFRPSDLIGISNSIAEQVLKFTSNLIQQFS